MSELFFLDKDQSTNFVYKKSFLWHPQRSTYVEGNGCRCHLLIEHKVTFSVYLFLADYTAYVM